MKMVNHSNVDLRLASGYTYAVRIIRNKAKFENAKEHFIPEVLLNICKLYIFSLNTTVHLQIPAVQKQPFPLLFGHLKEFPIYIQQILCNKILSIKIQVKLTKNT